MQKEIQLTDKTLLVVGLPSDAHSCEIQTNPVEGGKHICFLRGVPDYDCCYTQNIPIGYILLGIYPELTEEQAKIVVDSYYGKTKFHNYIEKMMFDTSKESFQSLMERENITGLEKYAILIKSK